MNSDASSIAAASSQWAIQVTAPLLLEAINGLIKIAINKNIPGIASTVGEDVIGILSLILTYAKAADKMTTEKIVQ